MAAIFRMASATIAAMILAAATTGAATTAYAGEATPSQPGERLFPEPPPYRVLPLLYAPMRDGVRLAADVFLPKGAGPFPTLLMRTRYMRTTQLPPHLAKLSPAAYFTARGYAVVVQDVRGRGDSDGEYGWYPAEIEDGYDSVEWAARQPWSNGNVCMFGLSWMGTVQWLAAKAHPPSLKCIAPIAAPGDYMNELPYFGGAFMHIGSLQDVLEQSGRTRQDSSHVDWATVLQHRPLLTLDVAATGQELPLYRKWLQHSTLDDFWYRIRFRQQDFEGINLPVLHVTGWFDADQPGSMLYWQGMQRFSPARDQQYLVVGPWDHIQTFIGGSTQLGELSFAESSRIDTFDLQLRFFDRYLKGVAGAFVEPPVRVFLSGSNEWRSFNTYPVPEATRKRWYLAGSGGVARQGRLVLSAPRRSPPDHYTFDPKNPAPVVPPVDLLNMKFLARDHRPLEARSDVLVFTSETLSEPETVLGPVELELYAATDGLDTDFTVTVLDVFPDGRAVRLGPLLAGIQRARYRDGLDREVPMTPGKPTLIRISSGHIGHTFLPGHRLRVHVSSSAFPFYSPNQNTGNPVATDTEWRVAQQTVFHDRRHPSALVLPTLPRSPSSP